MANWYDEWLTPQERSHLQVGQKGIRARRRQQAHEGNVQRAQQQTLDRERRQGAAYAQKMQQDTARSNQIKRQRTNDLMRKLDRGK